MKDSPARTDPEEAAIGRPTATAHRLVEASVSPNTQRAYAGALRRLDAWLDGRELDDAALGRLSRRAARRRPSLLERLDGGRRGVLPREARRAALLPPASGRPGCWPAIGGPPAIGDEDKPRTCDSTTCAGTLRRRLTTCAGTLRRRLTTCAGTPGQFETEAHDHPGSRASRIAASSGKSRSPPGALGTGCCGLL